MSPWRHNVRGSTVWRAATVALALGLAGVAYMGVGLYESNHESIARGKAALKKSNEAIRKNRRLGCHIGAFLVGIPIVKTPGTSQKTFEHSVTAAEGFLHDLKALDCAGLGQVTTGSINKALRRLHEVVPEGGGGSTGNPHSPGSPTGGGPEPAPPRPPTTTAPATSTTTTTTTTTTVVPPPIPRLVCHVDPILGRVCRLVP